MRRALEQARRGLGRTTPNPLVGACVVTPEGVVVGDGAHERAGGPHAEVRALDEAGAQARGATLYCTLEPCAHAGRTGPCTERIIAAGVARVVAAMEDPHPLVRGRGFEALRSAGIELAIGLERERAIRMNQPYLTVIERGRPFVVLKAAVSLDGCIAASPGARTALTSPAANRRTQYVRAWVDAVGIGVGTVLADDPILTARDVYRERPLVRVVFDRRLRTPADARLFSTLSTGPVIILTSPDALAERQAEARRLEDAGATLRAVSGGSLDAAVRALVPCDVQSLLLEGGADVHRTALREGLVDYVQVFVTPVVLGGGGTRLAAGVGVPLAGLIESRVEVLGPDVLIEGYVHGPH